VSSDVTKTSLLAFEEISRGDPDPKHVFTVRSDVVRSRTSGREIVVDRIDARDFVNVIAYAEEDGQRFALFVRQWRFGSAEFSLEFPAGLIDDGEDPRDAALRELREETGYAPVDAAEVMHLGTARPNPAILTNWQWTYLVPRAVKVAELDLDDTEEIEVVKVPVDQIDALVRSGELDSALVFAALLFERSRSTT
jgi:8-oxo-dGTP pyrophosphatase MutT (NUDIX family)